MDKDVFGRFLKGDKQDVTYARSLREACHTKGGQKGNNKYLLMEKSYIEVLNSTTNQATILKNGDGWRTIQNKKKSKYYFCFKYS